MTCLFRDKRSLLSIGAKPPFPRKRSPCLIRKRRNRLAIFLFHLTPDGVSGSK